MTTAVASPFDFSEVINKNNKMLNYKNNLLTGAHGMVVPCSSANMPSPSTTLLDRKAVGTPSTGPSMYQRRHSVTLPSTSRLNQNQFSMAKTSELALLNAGLMTQSSVGSTAINNNHISSSGNNKENRLRERSFSETGERLLHKSAASLSLGPLSSNTAAITSSNGNGPVQGPQSGQVNSSRYKTELCRPFEENGWCKYGDKCQFAHGHHELRSLSRHPKYKTELCRTFHTIGFCPYGPRCHFIHNAEERRGPPSAPISPLSASNGKLERPRLHHSISFAGFPSAGCVSSSSTSSAGMCGGVAGGRLPTCLTSRTPPPIFSLEEELSEILPSRNPFAFSFCPSLSLPSGDSATLPGGPLSSGQGPPSPTGSSGGGSSSNSSSSSSSSMPFLFRAMTESPPLFSSPSSQPDSLSDQEGYHSSTGSSGSESPVLDTARRLPIFSRLSISDD